MENTIDYPKKVNYSEYEHSYSDDLLKRFTEDKLNSISNFDAETMRGLIYGYTFTEDYAKGIIPDTLSMDYWLEKNDCEGQLGLIYEAIESTGDGTMDNPYCVICVGQEYEFLRHGDFGPIKIIRQRLLPGRIDCIDIEGIGYSKSVYFDMSRWFERVDLLKSITEN